MGNQANILSFDEAKRGSGARRSSAAARELPARKRGFGAGQQGAARRAAAPPAAARISGTASRPSSATRVTVRATSLPIRATARSSAPAPASRPASAARAPGVPARPASSAFAARTSATARDIAAPRAGRGAHAKQSAAGGFGEVLDEAEDSAPQKRSRFQEFRRKRQKDRADRKFDKQFGGASRTSDAASSGPRAAVYKGEMGASHKRAARMQNETAGTAKASGLARPGLFAKLAAWRQSPKFIAAGGVMVCLALSCWFLYTPAQQLYQSVREHDRLEAEYAAIEQRNALLASEVGTLQTDAGIEDRAHEQFGWVPEGYQTANVRGLSDETQQNGASGFTANIVPGSVEAPETWYSPVLDVLFGVE